MRNRTIICCALLMTCIIASFPGAVSKAAQAESGKKSAAPEKKIPHGEKEPAPDDPKRAHRIEETLEFGTQEERIRAIGGIQGIKDTAERSGTVRKLIDLMKDETDPDVLIKAITVLSEMKESSAIPLMIEKIGHPVEDVRTAAVYAIKNLKAKEAKDVLVRALKEQKMENPSNYTTALIGALGVLQAAEIVPFVREALESHATHRTNREEMVLFLGTTPAPESKEILLKLYRNDDEDTSIRSYAASSLARLACKEAAPDIRKVIADIESYDFKKRQRYHTLHLYSIAALAKLGDSEAVPKLISALRSNNAQVRLKAIALIKDLGDKRTIDILRYKMKYDQNAKVRSAAKKALEEMGVDAKE